MPGPTVGVGTDQTNIAPEINQAVMNAPLQTALRRAVCGVFLTKAAKVQLHASGQLQRWRRPLQLLPAQPGQTVIHGIVAGQAARLEVPGFTQHAGADIEQPLAR